MMKSIQSDSQRNLLFIAVALTLLSSTAASASMIAGCPMLPADNIWNTPVDALPLDPRSQEYINTIGAGTAFHPDFGEPYWTGTRMAPIGIPYNVVSSSQPKTNIFWLCR